MAFEYHTYQTQVCLAYGPYVGSGYALAQAAGYQVGVPDFLWPLDSFEWVIEYYEDAAKSNKLDLAGGTAILYIGLDEDGASLTQIGTGVVSGTGDYIVTYSVPSGAIPAACCGAVCLLVAEVTGTAKRTTIIQRVNVLREYGTPGASASNYADVAAGTGLTAGKVYYWDTSLSSPDWTLADPDAAICETCELWLAISATALISEGLYAATVSGADQGDPVYLSDAGALTSTVPTALTDAGRVGRIVAWQRNGTSIRFSGHWPGVTFEAVS